MNPGRILKKIIDTAGLFKRAFGQYRFQIIFTVILGFIGGFLGSFGIGSLLPLFSLLTHQETNDPITALTKNIFDFLGINFSLPFMLSFMVFLFAAKSTVLFTATYINSSLSNNYQQDTRKKLLKDTLGSNWLFLLNQKLGFVDRIILEDVSPAAGILLDINDLVLKLTSILTYGLVAMKISGTVTIATFVAGAIMFMALKPLFYKIRKLHENMALTGKSTAHYIIESMLGIKTIKAASVEEHIFGVGSGYFDSLKKDQLKSILYQGILTGLFEPASVLFVSGILIFYYQKPDFNVASFAVIFYIVQKIFTLTQAVQSRIGGINASIPYLKSMLDYQDAVKKEQELPSGNMLFSFNDRLSAKNICFAYSGYKDTLSDISFEVKKGEMIGIVGPSGTGKTTLVDILLRLLELQKGNIFIDEVNINTISRQSWRQNVGYVSQDIFVFNDTIENNIRFYNDSLSDADIKEAAKMANIYDFTETLPDKFQTIIGERGVKLSNGQRQRIVLARVLARKSPIIILDEATSSLDNESEALIQQTIKNIKSKVTMIVIAHRLSTVMNADRLFIIEDGKITESGTPKELTDNKESYFYKVSHIKSN